MAKRRARGAVSPTPDRLAEIEARAAAATPGPWRRGENGGDDGPGMARRIYLAGGPQGNDLVCWLYRLPDPHEDPRAEQALRDGAFIAHAREDVLYLLAEVRRLQAEVSRS